MTASDHIELAAKVLAAHGDAVRPYQVEAIAGLLDAVAAEARREAEIAMRERAAVIEKQIADLQAWLDENAPYCDEDQRHLDENTVERAYWHYGRLIALRDVVSALPTTPDGTPA